jgi:predicted RNA methylase
METIFTNDIDKARHFFDEFKFRVRGRVVEFDYQEITEEIKEPSQVVIQRGTVGVSDFFDRLVKEFGFEYLHTKEVNVLTQEVIFQTPLGFEFHVQVIFA